MISQNFTVSQLSTGRVERQLESELKAGSKLENNVLTTIARCPEPRPAARADQSSFLAASQIDADHYGKPSSAPRGFAFELASEKNSLEVSSSFGSLSSQEYDEDTDSDICPQEVDEDELANEIRSRNEADDELASLFEADSSCASAPCEPSRPVFARPGNPVVQDRRFLQPRCSAPSFEGRRPCPVYLTRPTYCVYNSLS